MTAGMSMGLRPHPPAAVTGITAISANETTMRSVKKQYNSVIAEHRGDGNVRWGFNIDDDNFRKWGIDIQKDLLPAVCFEFVGDTNVPAPPPKCMDIVITSYWSMILPPSDSEPKSTWIPKLLHFFRSTGNTQAISYSNLAQITALKADLSNLRESSHYRAKVKVRPAGPPPASGSGASSGLVPVVPGPFRLMSWSNDRQRIQSM
jgi:hypothetical protein